MSSWNAIGRCSNFQVNFIRETTLPSNCVAAVKNIESIYILETLKTLLFMHIPANVSVVPNIKMNMYPSVLDATIIIIHVNLKLYGWKQGLRH